MIPIDLITEEELNRRINKLSAKLKDAATSERNVRIVNQVCDNKQIADDDKREMVHQIVGLVILGIVHEYDVGAEINEALALNDLQVSQSLANELSAKIFAPIKAELDSNYDPLPDDLGR